MGASTRTDDVAPMVADMSMLVDCLDDAVVAVDADHRIVAWNPAATRLFGHSAEAALGASRSLVEPVDDPEGWPAGVLNGRPTRFRAERVDRLGRALPLDVTASPLVDAAGKVIGIVQLLRPAPEGVPRPLIEFAEDMARVGHWRIEVPEDRHTWSDEVYRIHGFEPGSTIIDSDRALALYHPDDRARVKAAIFGAIHDGGDLAFEARIVRPSGEIRQVVGRGTTERGPDGRANAVVGVLQDVTEQRSREEVLAERDRSFRILREAIDAVQDSISVYDEGDRFVVANRKFFELYPYLGNEDKLRGKTFEQVLRISLQNNVFMNHRSIDDPEGYVRERLSDRVSGRQMPERRLWNGHWYLIRENRTPSGYTISTRVDITDRKDVESELAATSAVLQATLDTMPNPLVAFDRDNRLVAWNLAFAELVGVDPDRMERGRYQWPFQSRRSGIWRPDTRSLSRSRT